MKIMIVGDVHFSSKSTLIPERVGLFNKRLWDCVQSINFVEEYALSHNVDQIAYIGDFFDRNTLNTEEINALSLIKWSNISHVMLLGNHELGGKENSFNVLNLFKLNPNFEVISIPKSCIFNDTIITYLPYIRGLLPFQEYHTKKEGYKNIVISHNDVIGCLNSRFGFDPKSIAKNCDLFINGHYHCPSFIDDNEALINIGTLIDQGLSELGATHHCILLDTEKNDVILVNNPYSYNFSTTFYESLNDGFIPLKVGVEREGVDYIENTEDVRDEVKHYLVSIIHDNVSENTTLMKLVFYYNRRECVVFYTHNHSFYQDSLALYINDELINFPDVVALRSYLRKFLIEVYE